MKLLIFEWAAGTYTYPDIIDSFSRNGIEYKTVSYKFDGRKSDEFFEYRFGKELEEEYDAVFSVNYFPLVAKCCDKAGVRYISWSYDNPLNVKDIEETLGLPCNTVFFFDKVQVKGFRNKGFDNVYHMPLAANCRRLDAIKLSDRDMVDYGADISFVGRMYDSLYNKYMALMDDYCKGYVEAAMAAQSKILGYYMIDEMLDDGFMKRINDHFKELDPNTDMVLPREALSFAVASEITRGDRIIILNILSKRYKLNLYSWDFNELLQNVNYKGSCDYMTQMPRIFKASRINLNINLRISQSGIPLRVMDILGSGGFLISNFQPEIAEYFIDGQEVVMYESVEDAIEKAIFYLNNEDTRKQIAIRGHEKVKEMFSYDGQLTKIFEMSGLMI